MSSRRPFHQRLATALTASSRGGRTFEEKRFALWQHMKTAGVKGPHGTRGSLDRYLRGDGLPTKAWCRIAAEYLGVSPDYLTPERQQAPALSRGRAQRAAPSLPSAERWEREPTFIVGGGPSAGRHDLTRLHQHGIVVAVNDSATKLPDADVLFTASPPWIRHRRDLIRRHKGQLVVRTEHSPGVIRSWRLPSEALILPLRAVPGFSEAERNAGHNSGTEAIYWAAAQGARRIVLIGFDMDGPGHWHGGYEWFPDRETRRDAEEAYPLWAVNMEQVARDLGAAGVKCWNANPFSAIRAFPFAELGVLMIRQEGMPS